MPRSRRVRKSAAQKPAAKPKNATPLSLPPPAHLQLLPLELAGEQYALFSFPLPEPVCPPGLTLAEREVLKAVLRGASNDEIAASRGVSTNTVANQLRSIYSKLGVGSRRELAARYMRAAQPP